MSLCIICYLSELTSMMSNYIIINIHNEPDLLQLIMDTIPYIPGWITNSNRKEWKG